MANIFSYFDDLFSSKDNTNANWGGLQDPTEEEKKEFENQNPGKVGTRNSNPTPLWTDNKTRWENNGREEPKQEKTRGDKVLDFGKAVTEAPDRILSSNWIGNTANVLDTSFAAMLGLPGLAGKFYVDYNKALDKAKAEEEKKKWAEKESDWVESTSTGDTEEEPKYFFTSVNDEEKEALKQEESESFGDKAAKFWYELRILGNNTLGFDSFDEYLKDDIKSSYNQAIQELYEYKQGIKDGSITQEQYDEKLEDLTQTLLNDYLNEDWAKIKDEVAKNKEQLRIYAMTIDNDVNRYGANLNITEKLDKIDPHWQTASNTLNKISNSAVQNIMETANERLKYYKGQSSEIVRDLYEIADSDVLRTVNEYLPTRRVLTALEEKYGTSNPQFYDKEDKEFYDRAKRIENILNTILLNKADYYSAVIDYADASTDTLIMPERVRGMTLHEWNLRGLDNVLTDKDYEGLWGFGGAGNENYSAKDLIGAMSANLAADYAIRNGDWFESLWAGNQRRFRPIGPLVQEVGQQTVGRAYVDLLYNPLSEPTGEIPFSFMNEDNALLSIMSTNQSTRGRLVQKYTANILEYAPELLSEVVTTAYGASIPSRIRNIGEFRLLMNTRGWSILKKIKAASKAKGISLLEGVKEAADTGKIVHNGGTLFDVGKDIANVRNWERALTWGATDLVPEMVWDQIIDASLSSIDTDFGSDTSMAFSLGGTFLGNFLGKLGELGLYRMGGNLLDNLIHLNNKSITRGTVWDMLNMLDEDNVNKILKLQFGKGANINTAGLGELSRYVNDYREIAKATRKALASLSGEEARKVTQAIKNGVYESIKPYINQVYGGQSSFAKKVAQLVADDRTNVADLTKYLLGINNKIDVFGWKSAITLSDGKQRYAWNYKEDIDTIFNQGNFRDRLRDGFSLADLEALKKAGYSWADPKSGYMKKVGDDKYFFTKDGLDAAKNDIMTTSLNVKTLAKASQSAEEFDSLMKNSTLRNISDETLQDIKDSGAYDVLADILGEIEQLCKVKV